MKAAVFNTNGKGFEYMIVPKPKLSPGYVLIKVFASPINPYDAAVAKGFSISE